MSLEILSIVQIGSIYYLININFLNYVNSFNISNRIIYIKSIFMAYGTCHKHSGNFTRDSKINTFTLNPHAYVLKAPLCYRQ